MITNNLNNDFTPPSPLNIGVLFLVFNRIETTKEVFRSIQQAKPPRLYIASDGARDGRKDEQETVDQIRKFITSNIDWNCEIHTLFRESNLGCKMAVSSAISWFFEHEEMGIILEDDCLPSLSFFWYCEDLLNRYKNNKDIFLISGSGEPTLINEFKSDYSFTKYPFIWGWASWKRVWDQYDVNISDWMDNKSKLIDSVSEHKNTRRFWSLVLQGVYDFKIDTWDYQLSYIILKNHGKCIIPKYNLVSNIGFGPNATHTHDANDGLANRGAHNIKFPIAHPKNRSSNRVIDDFFDNNRFSQKSTILRIKNKIVKVLKAKGF